MNFLGQQYIDTAPKAFYEIPYVMNTQEYAPYPINHHYSWRPFKDPYFLLLPCHHMLPRNQEMEERLKHKFCPVCAQPYTQILTFESTLHRIHEIQKQFHHVQTQQHVHGLLPSQPMTNNDNLQAGGKTRIRVMKQDVTPSDSSQSNNSNAIPRGAQV